jgi:CarD family transcriptional regulator
MAFDKGDLVVYPAHGVGRVVDIETRVVGDFGVVLVVIVFEQDRLTVRVPAAKAGASGLRKLSSRKIPDGALVMPRGRPRTKSSALESSMRRNTAPRSIPGTPC